jgi:hypothetical protein
MWKLFLVGLTHNLARTAFICLMIMFGFFVYATCTQRTNTASKTIVHPDASVYVEPQFPASGDGWQLSLPGDGWVKSEPTPEAAPVVMLMATNEHKQTLVYLIKEPTDDTYSQYVMGALRATVSRHVPILAVKSIKIHGQTFAEVRAGQGNIWFYIAVKDGFGYVLTCGGARPKAPTDAGHDNTLELMCHDLAGSLQIK